MITLTVGAATAGLVFSPVLDVDHFVVTGVTPEEARVVRGQLSISRRDPILLTDTGEAEAAVESLSWVGDAQVKRELPGTIRISVTPRPPVAWVKIDGGQTDGHAALVDRRGLVVLTVPAAPTGLPQLAGEAGSITFPDQTDGDQNDGGRKVRAAIGLGARVAAALPPPDTLHATTVTVVGGEVTVLLADGPEIRVGDDHALAHKMKAAAAVLRALGGGNVSYIDVRVPSAPATGSAP